MGKLALLCPGQGSQNAEMFDHPLLADLPATLGLMDLCAEILQQQVTQLQPRLISFSSPRNPHLLTTLLSHGALFSNQIAQPLVVAASLAGWLALGAPRADMVLGYSVGEVTAWSIAGALRPEQAVQLAYQRALLMNQACAEDSSEHMQGMLAVTGLAQSRLAALLHAPGVSRIYLAIDNGPESAVIGGHIASLTHFAALAEDQGGKATMLPINIASHTPLTHAAQQPFLEVCQNAGFQRARFPVSDSTTGSLGKDNAPGKLSRQLSQTLHWYECMHAAVEAGVTVALEVGPSNTLARMFARLFPEVDARSISDFKTRDGLQRWLAQRI